MLSFAKDWVGGVKNMVMLHVICDSPQPCPRLSRLDSACTAFKSSGAGPGCNGRWPFDSVVKQGCCHEKKCLGTSGVLLYGTATQGGWHAAGGGSLISGSVPDSMQGTSAAYK